MPIYEFLYKFKTEILCYAFFFIVISHWVLFIATTVTGPGQLCAEGPASVFGTEGHFCVSAGEKNK